MKITNNDHARALIAAAGITTDNVTRAQLELLWYKLSLQLPSGTYAMNMGVDLKFMTCRTDQWHSREAVSFNQDGFIGFAGWADSSNIKPILDAVGEWLEVLGIGQCRKQGLKDHEIAHLVNNVTLHLQRKLVGTPQCLRGIVSAAVVASLEKSSLRIDAQ